MNEHAARGALKAVQGLAESLAGFDLPDEVERRIGLIISVARSGFNVLSIADLRLLRESSLRLYDDAEPAAI